MEEDAPHGVGAPPLASSPGLPVGDWQAGEAFDAQDRGKAGVTRPDSQNSNQESISMAKHEKITRHDKATDKRNGKKATKRK